MVSQSRGVPRGMSPSGKSGCDSFPATPTFNTVYLLATRRAEELNLDAGGLYFCVLGTDYPRQGRWGCRIGIWVGLDCALVASLEVK
jgi:hypothetical protein